MAHTLLICDLEVSYARKLAEFINARQGFPFVVRFIREINDISRMIEKWKVDVVIATEDTIEEVIKYLPRERIILASSGSNASFKEKNDIYKYQNCESIIRDVLTSVSRMDGLENLIKRNGPMTVLGFFSPIHSLMQTPLALVMGQLIAQKKRVLYINLEGYSGVEELIQKQFDMDLSDVLYEIVNNTDKTAVSIGKAVCQLAKLDLLPPMRNQKDLSSVSIDNWKNFFELIERGSDYEYLILDISESVRDLLEMLIICKKVYMPVDSDRLSKAKICQFYDTLGDIHREQLEGRIVQCDTKSIAELNNLSINSVNGPLGELCKELLSKE